MSKGGGNSGIAEAQAATDQSIALQRDIYNQNKEMAQPWYQGGKAGLSRLLDLMGLQGGSVQTADQMKQSLSPQFTSTPQAQPGQWVDDKGMQYGRSDLFNVMNAGKSPGQKGYLDYAGLDTYLGNASNAISSGQSNNNTPGYYLADGVGLIKPMEQAPVTDESGLNAALQAGMAGQQNPEGWGSLTQAFGADQFQADPGYAFRMAEGNKGIERAMAAAGKTLNPEAAKALLRFNQGTAADEYTNAYNRYNNDQSNLFNRLASISGFGQTASGQIANAGTNYANMTGDALTNMANVQMANQKSGSSMFGDLMKAGVDGAKIWALTSDARLKHDIEHVGNVDGVNVYEFRYLPEIDPTQTKYRGAMAQELLLTHPDAVHLVDDYYKVDYSQLPVKMEAVWR